MKIDQVFYLFFCDLLENWQRKIQEFQSKLFRGHSVYSEQKSLFEFPESSLANNFSPLELTPLPMSFWRWPKSLHQGPAIYTVMDRPKNLDTPIILYIGETVAADKRWKGEHDCKAYLASYCEGLSFAGLKSQLSIRFWMDVPKATKPRRKLEQELIQKW